MFRKPIQTKWRRLKTADNYDLPFWVHSSQKSTFVLSVEDHVKVISSNISRDSNISSTKPPKFRWLDM